MTTVVEGIPQGVDCSFAVELPENILAIPGLRVRMQLRESYAGPVIAELTVKDSGCRFIVGETHLHVFFEGSETNAWNVTPQESFSLLGTLIASTPGGHDVVWLPFKFEFVGSLTR